MTQSVRGRAGLLAILLLSAAGCDSSVMAPAPAPSPSPSPSAFPQLAPNATALVNLDPVLRLERASGRPTRLVAVSGVVNGEGRLAGVQPWHYTFKDPGDVPGAVYQWRVDASGAVSFDHFGVCAFSSTSDDLSAGPGLDSDRVIALAMDHGVRSFLRRHDGQGRFAVTYVNTGVQVIAYATDCYRPWVLLDRLTGRLVDARLDCSGPMSHPCVGPGVY